MNKEQIIRNLRNLKVMYEQGKTIFINSSNMPSIDIVLKLLDEIEFDKEEGTEFYKVELNEYEFYFDMEFSEDGSIIRFPTYDSTQDSFDRINVNV